MVVYSYDGHTGRFIAGELADPDPLEPGYWIIPANATTEMPPSSEGVWWPYWSKARARWILKDEGTVEAARLMRTRRNECLYCSDWTQLPDVPLNDEQRDAWRVYRQQLRDLPNLPEWPLVKMPEKPV